MARTKISPASESKLKPRRTWEGKLMMAKWRHPGGKQGAASLTDRELLAILISTGIKGKLAEKNR